MVFYFLLLLGPNPLAKVSHRLPLFGKKYYGS